MSPLRAWPIRLAFRQPTANQSIAFGLGAALALIFGSGSSAAAACGDWLTSNPAAPRVAAAAQSLPAGSLDDSPGHSSSAEPSAPCDGPHCGRAPQLPAPPPSPSLPPTSKVQGCDICDGRVWKSLNVRRTFADLHQAERPGHPLRIDRPPAL